MKDTKLDTQCPPLEALHLEPNEEELKSEVVVPFLRKAGFQPGTLRFERSFTIRLGHGVYTVDGGNPNRARGRLDVLCTSNGKPLCIVELKHPSLNITVEDHAQGLSYARLTAEITPLVVVTNGRETHLLDTFSGQRISDPKPEFAKITPSVDGELRLRYEALTSFIGLSYENLLTFCRANNAITLGKFSANAQSSVEEKLLKKYIPDAYIERRIESSFATFLSQTRYTVFPIVGDAGVGKTATICRLVENSSEHPSIFLSGTVMGQSLRQELADSFNLIFSAEESSTAILKKIAAASKPHNKSFIIFIDAIDEWTVSDKAAQLSDAARACRALGLKMCVSCNSLVWPDIVTRRGISTDLNQNLTPNIPSLHDFSPTEVQEAQSKYEKSFSLRPASEHIGTGPVNPFAFRVACEVAHATGSPVSTEIASRRILHRFIALKKQKSLNPTLLQRTLQAVAGAFASEGRHSIREFDLLNLLNFPAGNELPEELFTSGILLRYSGPSEERLVAFYFGPLRDFIIAFDILRLPTCTTSEAASGLANPIKERAIAYFLKTGNATEQEKCLQIFAGAPDETFVRLLSWHGRNIHLSNRKLFSDISTRLGRFLLKPETTREQAEQCLVVLKTFFAGEELETIATEWLERLGGIDGDTSGTQIISHDLAKVVSTTTNQSLRRRIVSFCQDIEKDGYVRRYAIEAIRAWELDRTALFIKLISDPDANVHMWVRSWYQDLETEELRDHILSLLETTRTRESLFCVLGRSKLEDTGPKLLTRFSCGQDSGHNLWWLCRAFGFLKYSPALPMLCELLLTTKDRELRGHLLITLGDIGDRNGAISALKEILLNQPESVDGWWLNNAFTALCDRTDEDFLFSVAIDRGKPSCTLAINILARRYSPEIEARFWSVISKAELTQDELSAALNDLLAGLVATGDGDAKQFSASYSQLAAASLRKLSGDGTEASEQAFWGLFIVVAEDDILLEDIKSLLPKLSSKISAGRVLVTDESRLERLAARICPWIAESLDKCTGLDPLASNLVEFARIFGDDRVVEALSRNREKLLSVIELRYLESIENTIYLSETKVRWIA